jgi:polar amino acid transport system substrate-binding protein
MRRRFDPAWIGLALAFALTMSAGCPSNSDTSLKRIQNKGEIVFAMGRDFPPFYYRNEQNEWMGFEVDVAREVADRLSVGLKLVHVEWSGILDGLSAEMYDGVLSSMAVTVERKRLVAFSMPYYFSASQLFVHQEAGYRLTEDLVGKRIGVVGGTTYENDAAEYLRARVQYYEDAGRALHALDRKDLDGVITDRVVGRYLIDSLSLAIRPLGAPLRNEQIAIAFRKEDQALLQAVNHILEDMSKDDTLNRFIRKVAGQEYELK